LIDCDKLARTKVDWFKDLAVENIHQPPGAVVDVHEAADLIAAARRCILEPVPSLVHVPSSRIHLELKPRPLRLFFGARPRGCPGRALTQGKSPTGQQDRLMKHAQKE
jgi:hypothetical protein